MEKTETHEIQVLNMQKTDGNEQLEKEKNTRHICFWIRFN